MSEEKGIPVELIAAPDEPAAETTAAKHKRQRREAEAYTVDLLTNKGLYASFDVTTEVGDIVEDILREGQTVVFDNYCVGCRERSTFRVQTERIAARSISSRPGQTIIQPRFYAVQAVCQRASHVYSYVFTKAGNDVVKIGQFPSTADVSFGELRSIDKSLETTDRRVSVVRTFGTTRGVN